MKSKVIFLVLILLIASVILWFSTFVVDEGKQAVITQIGRPVKFVDQAGLNFKLPLIQQVHFLEKRLLPWDGDPENMQTLDKKRIFVDCWARWRISDLETYFKNVRTERAGQKFLDDLVDSAVRDVIARNNLIDLVRTTDNKLVYESQEVERQAKQEDKVTVGRENLEKEILRVAGIDLNKEYGMELIAVHIKRVRYNDQVIESVYHRMRSERERAALKFESEAQMEGNRIIGLTRKELDEIEGTSKQRSAEIRGEADATVIKMTAEAYGKNVEFFEFLQRLEMYKRALKKDTTLILSTNSDMFRLFKTTKPLPAATAPAATGAPVPAAIPASASPPMSVEPASPQPEATPKPEPVESSK